MAKNKMNSRTMKSLRNEYETVIASFAISNSKVVALATLTASEGIIVSELGGKIGYNWWVQLVE